MNLKIVDEISPTYFLTCSILCDLSGNSEGLKRDFIVGMLPHAMDPAYTFEDDPFFEGKIVWYHWNGEDWDKRVIAEDCPADIGLAAADLTGNGKLDIIFGEHPDHHWTKRGKTQSNGYIFWAEQPEDPVNGQWLVHQLAVGCAHPHDLLVGNISGHATPDVLVRNKHGKISWFAKPENPRNRWVESIVTLEQPGDGTALYDITGNGVDDVITGTGYYVNANGDGSTWKFVDFGLEDLNLDHELRVQAGDLLNDGSVSVVIAESEVYANARIVIMTSHDQGCTWNRKMIIDKERDFRALHTLCLFDIDGDGRLDIFVAEMEHGKTDGVERKPRWTVFHNKGDLEFQERTLLDVNLGGHQGCVSQISAPGKTDFIVKDFKSNKVNGCNGNNHIVHIRG